MNDSSVRTSRPSWDRLWLDTARAIGQRSLCSRDQVGAVIVTSDNRIVDTGYNGPPAGFTPVVHYAPNFAEEDPEAPCVKWCPRAMVAHRIATQVNPGTATNYEDCPSIHAEANALLFGDRFRRLGGTLYVSSTVCLGCAKLVANSGLARVVIPAVTSPADKLRAAARLGTTGIEFMKECGLKVTEL